PHRLELARDHERGERRVDEAQHQHLECRQCHEQQRQAPQPMQPPAPAPGFAWLPHRVSAPIEPVRPDRPIIDMSEPLHDHDVLTRFLLPDAGVRGVRVHLDAAWAQVRSRDDHGAAVTELLGEALAAAALFTGHAKVDGRLSVQLRGTGALRTLFAECTAAGTVRGIARVEGDPPATRDLRALGEDAVLAITIENPTGPGREPARYQGLVGLDSDSLAGAFEGYFERSEQLPT